MWGILYLTEFFQSEQSHYSNIQFSINPLYFFLFSIYDYEKQWQNKLQIVKKGWEIIIPFPKKKNYPVKNVYNENQI